MRVKNQNIIKALLNGTHVAANVEQRTKMLSVCVATNSKPWNTLNYWL